jgi:hypothetical protein
MPRLGGDDARSSSPRRGPARAFAPRVLPKPTIKNVLLLLAGLFIARNILRNDYRHEEMKYLKGSGMEQAEIDQYLPKTAEERRQYVADKANDMDRMKKDIAYLLQEVSDIRDLVKDSGGKGQRDTGLLEMDHVHEEKRKLHEEQLLREHPDFKTSPRIRKEDRKIRPDVDNAAMS